MLNTFTSISVTAGESLCIIVTGVIYFISVLQLNVDAVERKVTFLSHEGQRPGEDVHEVWQPVGVGGAVKLSNVHHVVLILQDSR